jgi:hypothetical protein
VNAVAASDNAAIAPNDIVLELPCAGAALAVVVEDDVVRESIFKADDTPDDTSL